MKRILDRMKIFMAYWFKGRTIYRIHPPYLYKLLDKMFDADQCYYDFDQIWQYQMDLKSQKEIISENRFGHRDLHLVKKWQYKSTFSKLYMDQLFQLYRLTLNMKPTRILDLGSGFGTRAVVFGWAAPKSKVIGVEEIDFLVHSSIKSRNAFQLNNLEYIHLNMDQFLDHYNGVAFDLVYLESHQDPNDIIRYLQKAVPFLAPNARIILEDIHGSAEMYHCWKEIIQWPNFNCTLETKRWGMLFCDPTMTPGNYVFCDYYLKPWQKYL